MSARLLFLVLLAAAVLWPGVAWGAVIVPDDHATITAAIASGADTVWVRDGVYDEHVTIARSLLLARLEPGGPPSPERPRISGLTLANGSNGWAHVVRFRVQQTVSHVSHDPGPDFWLEDCILEQGLVRGSSMTPRLRMTGCQVMGGVDAFPLSLEFTGNTVTGGGLVANYEAFATITGNSFSNAPGFAIALNDNDHEGVIADNVIADCGGGIHVLQPGGTRIDRNLVERCPGDGILADPGAGTNPIYASDNVLRDLGGDGIDFGSLGGIAIGNTIERVAGTGIRVATPGTPMMRVCGNRITDIGESGVDMAEWSVLEVFAGNTILRANWLGALLYNVTRADSNVIGRCRYDGIRALDTYPGSGTFAASHNTLYLNGGSGLTADILGPGTVTANIGYGNGFYALDWTAIGAATLACNLGYGNLAGNVRGAEPSETDREGNPLFCNLPADDVHLGPGSAAIFAGCETAGALGPGCSVVVGVAGAPPVAALRAGPLPARASLRFEWPAGAPVKLEVFDATGARRWSRDVAAWRSATEWDLRDESGARLAPGVYFARAIWAGRTSVARVVVAP